MAELETLKEQIADTLGCPRTPDGFCYCEMCQTKYWWKADTIIAEVNRRLEESALTPEQLPDVKLTIVLTAAQRLDPKNLKENAEKLLQYSKSVAAAQLKASLEVIK